VVAVFDRSSDRAAELASFARSKPYSGELSAMLANESLDAVSICTPPWLHAPQTIEALEADVNVLIEKPMAMTAEDCRRMCDAALRRGRTIAVSHRFRERKGSGRSRCSRRFGVRPSSLHRAGPYERASRFAALPNGRKAKVSTFSTLVGRIGQNDSKLSEGAMRLRGEAN